MKIINLIKKLLEAINEYFNISYNDLGYNHRHDQNFTMGIQDDARFSSDWIRANRIVRRFEHLGHNRLRPVMVGPWRLKPDHLRNDGKLTI